MSVDFIRKIDDTRELFLKDFESIDALGVDSLKIKFLGRNGLLSSLMKELGTVSKDQKPQCGKAVNLLKIEISNKINESLESNIQSSAKDSELDYTLPGRKISTGNLHPLTIVLNQICDIFKQIGFSVSEGPEIESDFNNFTALNIKDDHPARDMHDTFYFDPKKLLRTHTSPVQIRTMQDGDPPFRIIAPGKVYRCDSDVTHSPMFHQIEGLCIGKGINFGHLKSVLNVFAKNIFNKSCSVRLRPSFFPFTEPSAEVDISCVMCGGKGCRICSNSGWLEILGAGMVDPEVLKNVGIDPEIYTGYAFGVGVERVAMLKYAISDIRLFFENNYNFLKQFK